MPQSSVNAARFDPYKNFKFHVKWSGRCVAGFSKVMVKRSTEDFDHHLTGETSRSQRSLGHTKYEAITLERGVTHDLDFEQWAVVGGPSRADPRGPTCVRGHSRTPRSDITIEVYDEAGQLELVYDVFGCWVSAFHALPDADANAMAIELITLENEGWERRDSRVS